MSPLAWQGKCPGWLDREPSGVPSGLGSPARPAPACLTFSWKTHPVSWVPGAARRPWETFFAVTLGIRKGDSHAMRWGWASPLESGTGSGPSRASPLSSYLLSLQAGGPGRSPGPRVPRQALQESTDQPQGHTTGTAPLPSATPAGSGAGLTGGPGSPRGAMPSTSPGGPCRDTGQLLCDSLGGLRPSQLQCPQASTGPLSRRAEEPGKHRATHPLPSVTLLPLQKQKKM